MKIGSAIDLGEEIRRARRAQGLTQQDFAAIAGVGVRFLSELERGKESAEIGLTLRVLAAAGLDLFVEDRSGR